MRFILRFFGFLFSIGAMAVVIGAAAGGYFFWKYSATCRTTRRSPITSRR